MGSLADVDPVATVRAFLLGNPRVTDALGGSGRVRARNDPPYPMVVLNDPPGDDRDMKHLIAPLVQIEVLGDMDGSPGKPALRRILYIIIEELGQLPEYPTQPEDPAVVTYVSAAGGGGGSVPLPNGQPRYLTTVRLHMHPRDPSQAAQVSTRH